MHIAIACSHPCLTHDLAMIYLLSQIMEELNGLDNLRSLWLGKNKIEAITDIDSLQHLKQLDIHSNRLTTCAGLSPHLVALEELYLASNRIESIEGLLPLQTATGLRTVDISHNAISSLVGIEALAASLESLWLSSNAIPSFDALHPLKGLPKLESLYLEHCPIYKDQRAVYISHVREILPDLKQLDADMLPQGPSSPARSLNTEGSPAFMIG